MILGMLLMWFRMSMNFGSEPIFKPEEMRAAFHEDRVVRLESASFFLLRYNCWPIAIMIVSIFFSLS